MQGILDIFATYFLALAQMDKGDTKQAKFLFGQTMEMLPEPSPRQPYFTMFRWGATTNLGLLYADAGDNAAAVRYLTQDNPTPQGQGNLLRARALIWKDPFVPSKDTPKVIPPFAPPGIPRAHAQDDRQ